MYKFIKDGIKFGMGIQEVKNIITDKLDMNSQKLNLIYFSYIENISVSETYYFNNSKKLYEIYYVIINNSMSHYIYNVIHELLLENFGNNYNQVDGDCEGKYHCNIWDINIDDLSINISQNLINDYSSMNIRLYAEEIHNN